jgi:NAD(P)H-dependent FMN reductase
MTKIAMIAGSNRRNATSTLLLRHIGGRLEARGLAAALIDLHELPLPLYSPDAGDAVPNVRRLLDAVREADGLILATPEYHGSVSGALKNALDYVGVDLVSGKPVLSVSSSGGSVGVSSLTHLQSIVRNLHGVNCPEWISIGGETRRFGPDGAPADEKTKERVERALDKFVALTLALRGDAVRPAR